MTRLALFAGGSGCRGITLELVRRGHELTRIVPAWDSGGSSRAIRETLGILSVGDIRNALMTLAHGEGRAGNVVKTLNTRLSDTEDRAALRQELRFYMHGLHPPVLRYLKRFAEEVGDDFDLRRGSLGNFVLTGAYLAHGEDINAAIAVFRELCSIRSNAWPTSTDNDLRLDAVLRNGEEVHEQHRITTLDAPRAQIGIREIRLARAGGERATANQAVLDFIAQADAVVFGPGSFYTSVLPHVLVSGVAQVLAARTIPKIFVGNMLECPETTGLSLNGMLEAFLKHCSVTHVLANRSATPFQRSMGGRRYVTFAEEGPMDGVRVLSRDFEDPWQRGMHEASLVASAITELSAR